MTYNLYKIIGCLSAGFRILEKGLPIDTIGPGVLFSIRSLHAHDFIDFPDWLIKMKKLFKMVSDITF